MVKSLRNRFCLPEIFFNCLLADFTNRIEVYGATQTFYLLYLPSLVPMYSPTVSGRIKIPRSTPTTSSLVTTIFESLFYNYRPPTSKPILNQVGTSALPSTENSSGAKIYLDSPSIVSKLNSKLSKRRRPSIIANRTTQRLGAANNISSALTGSFILCRLRTLAAHTMSRKLCNTSMFVISSVQFASIGNIVVQAISF